MPVKSEAQKRLMATIKRVNMALPSQHWVPELKLLRQAIDAVLAEEHIVPPAPKEATTAEED